jgi:hypothetical protein
MQANVLAQVLGFALEVASNRQTLVPKPSRTPRWERLMPKLYGPRLVGARRQ